jgi:hypothetical protein
MNPEDDALKLFLEKNAGLRKSVRTFVRRDLPVMAHRLREFGRGAGLLGQLLNYQPYLQYTPAKARGRQSMDPGAPEFNVGGRVW